MNFDTILSTVEEFIDWHRFYTLDIAVGSNDGYKTAIFVDIVGRKKEKLNRIYIVLYLDNDKFNVHNKRANISFIEHSDTCHFIGNNLLTSNIIGKSYTIRFIDNKYAQFISMLENIATDILPDILYDYL